MHERFSRVLILDSNIKYLKSIFVKSISEDSASFVTCGTPHLYQLWKLMLSSQFLFKITLKPQVETVLGAKSSRLVTNISVAEIKLRACQYWLLLEICHAQILLTPIGRKERKMSIVVFLLFPTFLRSIGLYSLIMKPYISVFICFVLMRYQWWKNNKCYGEESHSTWNCKLTWVYWY